MSDFTEPLLYESTAIFEGGWLRRAGALQSLTFARRIVRVKRGFAYHSKRLGREVVIEAGFLTDLGSIPTMARAWLSPDDPWAQAYVVHDLLTDDPKCDWRMANLVLWDALGLPYRVYREDGTMHRIVCPMAARVAIFAAVRLYEIWKALCGKQ